MRARTVAVVSRFLPHESPTFVLRSGLPSLFRLLQWASLSGCFAWNTVLQRASPFANTRALSAAASFCWAGSSSAWTQGARSARGSTSKGTSGWSLICPSGQTGSSVSRLAPTHRNALLAPNVSLTTSFPLRLTTPDQSTYVGRQLILSRQVPCNQLTTQQPPFDRQLLRHRPVPEPGKRHRFVIKSFTSKSSGAHATPPPDVAPHSLCPPASGRE